MPYSLSSDKIRLRAVEQSDLDTIYLLENEIAESGSSVINQPLSRKMLWDYIESYSADIAADRQLRLMIEDTGGNTVGAIDVSDYDPVNRRGFVGISILSAHRGKKYGTAALDVLCRYCADALGMHQLAALVAADNSISRHLFAEAGFKSAGRLRSWLRRGKTYEDVLIFQKLF